MRRSAVLCFTALVAALPLRGEAAAPSRGDTQSGTAAPVLFTADEVQYDEDLGLIVAKGHVEISQRDQILLADVVTYNQRTDTVTASGHVSLLQPTGDITFADYTELHNELRDGFIKDVRLLLSDRSRMAGNTARRIDGNRTEIRRAVYSPCDLCREDPTAPPVWQIKAEEVVHDKQMQIVEYRDAVLEIDGVPIIWTPYFSHPDPSVKRQSGFLSPVVGISNTLGFHTTLPYYWAISPDKDFTFLPIFTTSEGQVLGGEYRQRLGYGNILFDGSINVGGQTLGGTPDNPTAPVGAVRGHLFGTSEFDINENWRTGLDVQRVSDQTYLALFHYQSPATFLVSHGYAEGFGERSYTNISSYAFQSLRFANGDSTQPIVAPVASYDWSSQPDALGGRFNFQGNALNLLRLQGTDMRRLSADTGWQVPFDGLIGDRFSFAANLRNDGYYSNNLPLGSTSFGGASTLTSQGVFIPSLATDGSALTGRSFPQLSLVWRYPWIRRGESSSQLIEPIAALIAGPNGGNPANIPNEDSQGFEFDETTLFQPNRFPGLDRVDTGQRVDYGLRGGYYDDSGGSVRFLVGQSYRFEESSAFLPGSGLENRLSDIVGSTTIAPNPYLNLIYRFRLASDNFALRRQEVSLTTGPRNLNLSLSYLQIAAIPSVPDLTKTSELSLTVNADLTQYWSMQVQGLRDFAGGAGVEELTSRLAVTYHDECISFITSVSQSGLRNRDVRPGSSLLFTVVFKNLGEFGARALSF